MTAAYRIKVEQDEYPESPREWDNLGTMECWHRRYNLGDGQITPEEAIAIYESDEYISLPLYLYDHSGITMSTAPFSCPWDSGQVGIIYVSIEKVVKEFGELTAEIREQVYNILVSEVKAYDQFLIGDVWFYSIQKAKVYTADDDDTLTQWETIEACGGFYGREDCEEQAKEALKSLELRADELRECIEQYEENNG